MTVWLPGMRCVCLADCLWSVADASVVIFDGPVKDRDAMREVEGAREDEDAE